MATIEPVLVRGTLKTQLNEVYVTHDWELGSGDIGAPVTYVDYPDRTVQVSGTFDTATVVIEGSLDGTNYHTLTDPVGNELEFTDGDIATVMEVVIYLRPRVVNGTGSTAAKVRMLTRREVV